MSVLPGGPGRMRGAQDAASSSWTPGSSGLLPPSPNPSFDSKLPGADMDLSSLRAWGSNGLPKERFLSMDLTRITVVQLGMSLTEFFTSSSVTSTMLQCSSSEGRGSSPFLVTQGCNCGGEDREGQGHR